MLDQLMSRCFSSCAPGRCRPDGSCPGKNHSNRSHAGWLPILFTVAITAGCGADAQEESAAGNAFTVLHSGNYGSGGSTTKRAEVFRSQEGYESALARYSSEAAANIDFSGSRVLLVAMGQRSSGGYGIQVSAVEVESDRAVVKVDLTHPGPTCVVTDALTNPYQLVEIPTTGEILVREELMIKQCD